ncbi:MAG: VOC family protein [Planctomycetes bacterium]|nr:VOC family protein [Planctomycetota bacterium]
MDSYINSMVDQYDRGRLSRRQLITMLTGFAAVAGLGPGAGVNAVMAQDTAESTFQATSLNHIALSVTDVGRSRDFYVKHLGLRVTRDGRNSCFLNVGPNFLALFRARQAGLNHYCYTVKGYTADSAAETLQAAGFKPRRAENRVYFDDPDGLEVQLSAPNG